MRVATWNVEWANPNGARGRAVRRHLEKVSADVVVTTEDHLVPWSTYPYVIDAGPEWGYPVVETRRKVIAWSVAPWRNVLTHPSGAAKGRLVVGETTVGSVTAPVVAVCIPWSACHVSTGRRDRARWDEHLEFCEILGELLPELPRPVVVAGDFNQAIPRRRQPQTAFDALCAALGKISVVTSGVDSTGGPLIDHVAVGHGLTVKQVDVWPNVIDGRRLSDHSGVAVALQ